MYCKSFAYFRLNRYSHLRRSLNLVNLWANLPQIIQLAAFSQTWWTETKTGASINIHTSVLSRRLIQAGKSLSLSSYRGWFSRTHEHIESTNDQSIVIIIISLIISITIIISGIHGKHTENIHIHFYSQNLYVISETLSTPWPNL